MAPHDQPLDFVLKIASRCNLNCTYCYVYNKEDTTWRSQPRVMSDATFRAAVERIAEYCAESKQRRVRLIFHGGEPLLVGPGRFAELCSLVRTTLGPDREVCMTVQTNGTLLDEEWVSVFQTYGVELGVSIDGPRDVNDRMRVDHSGAGSYDAVMRGVDHLLRGGIPLHFLTVIPLGDDGLRVHEHLLGCGASTINYLFPDYRHDDMRGVHAKYGPTPCADVLLPIFHHEVLRCAGGAAAEWRVPLMHTLSKMILGGDSDIDVFGNHPLSFVFINTDGTMEALDVLRVCAQGMAASALNVHRHPFAALAELSDFHRRVIFEGMPLPAACAPCPERASCGGGYLPHRYSEASGFDNPSVWCADILALFGYLRAVLGVECEETLLRRQALEEIAHGH